MALPDLEFMKQRQPGIIGEKQSFRSAVLLPLLEIDNETYVLFEKRAAGLKNQPGEICFPGGAIDKTDSGPDQAAVRETSEELKIPRGEIQLVAPLDLMVSPFNVIIYPFVGIIQHPDRIRFNPDEVEELFYVPLPHLLQQKPLQYVLGLKMQMPEDYPYELVPGGRNYPYRVGKMPQLFYFWEDRVIWGMTARILDNFLELLRSR